jgi:hypothetical protein
MDDGWGHNFQHNRKSHKNRGFCGLVSRACRSRRHHRYAVGLQQRKRLVLVQSLAPSAFGFGHDLPGAPAIYILELRNHARRSLQPAAVAVHGGERHHGRLRKDVGRDPGRIQEGAALGQPLSPHEHRKGRLVPPERRLGDRGRYILRLHTQRRHERSYHGVDPRIIEDQL